MPYDIHKIFWFILTIIHSFIRIIGSCFNHLRNLWIGAIEIHLSRKVTQILVEELNRIPPHLRVKFDIGNVCWCVDKEFNFTANYPKGHGSAFHDWMRRYHPGELMMPIVRTLGGDRQDSSFEGTLPVYIWAVNTSSSFFMRNCVQVRMRTYFKRTCLSFYVQPRWLLSCVLHP